MRHAATLKLSRVRVRIDDALRLSISQSDPCFFVSADQSGFVKDTRGRMKKM